MAERVNLKLTLDDRQFVSKTKTMLTNLKKMDSLLKRQVSTIRQISTAEGRRSSTIRKNIALKQKELSINKKITREIAKGNKRQKSNTSGAVVSRGKNGGLGLLAAGALGGASLLGGAAIYGGARAGLRTGVRAQDQKRLIANLLGKKTDSIDFQAIERDLEGIAVQTKSDMFDTFSAYQEALSANIGSGTAAAIAKQVGILTTGNTEISQGAASSFLNQGVNVLGLTSESQVASLANQLTGLINVSAGEAGAVVGAVPDFLPQIKALGATEKTISEGFALFSALTQQGFGPEEAGVRVKNVLKQIIKGKLEDRGVTARSIEENGLLNEMEKLRKSYEKLSGAERLEAIQEDFGESRASQGANIFAGLEEGQLKTLASDINLGDAMENFRNSSEDVTASFRQLKTRIIIATDNFLTNSGIMEKLSTGMDNFGEAMGPTGEALKAFGGVITLIIDILRPFGAALAATAKFLELDEVGSAIGRGFQDFADVTKFLVSNNKTRRQGRAFEKENDLKLNELSPLQFDEKFIEAMGFTRDALNSPDPIAAGLTEAQVLAGSQFENQFAPIAEAAEVQKQAAETQTQLIGEGMTKFNQDAVAGFSSAGTALVDAFNLRPLNLNLSGVGGTSEADNTQVQIEG